MGKIQTNGLKRQVSAKLLVVQTTTRASQSHHSSPFWMKYSKVSLLMMLFNLSNTLQRSRPPAGLGWHHGA